MNKETRIDVEEGKSNFTAGLSMPLKLLRSSTAVVDGVIRPKHIRIYPTYRCNANCSFCAFQKWARNEEFPTAELLEVIRHFHTLGTRAITFSGGGEPTLHPGFDDALDVCRELDVQAGLITNGLLWTGSNKQVKANGKLVWARMSVVDVESGNYDTERLRRFSESLPDVAVGCYAAITRNADIDTILRLADIAEEVPGITHLKLGEDTVNYAPEKITEIESALKGYKKTIIHRHLLKTVKGMQNCLVSLLRPVIAPDGYVYPCCNLELEDVGYVEPVAFRMVHWREFSLETQPFNGSICPRCIWDQYNQVLAGLTAPLQHERFL